MTLFICSFCGDKRKSKRSKISHETLCYANPNRKESTLAKNRITGANKKAWCKWCKKETNSINLRRHEARCRKNPAIIEECAKECPVCKKIFFGKKRKHAHIHVQTHTLDIPERVELSIKTINS